MPSQNEIRKQVTDSILESIESGKSLPWRKPWRSHPNAGRPTSVASRKPYRGINLPLLQMFANRFGFSSKYWATYRQWESLGGQVRRRPDGVKSGSWSATAILFKPVTKSRIEDGDEVEDTFYLMRTFRLFNADQVEGAEQFQVNEDDLAGDVEPDFEPAEKLIAATEADLRYGGERAFYSPKDDFIQVPHKHRFTPVGSFYETCLHELSHWSLNERRMNWTAANKANAYAEEELVAEMASSFLSTELGVPQSEGLDNHAAYLKSWLQALKGDSSFIFKASTQASKVTDFLLDHVPQEALYHEDATVTGGVE